MEVNERRYLSLLCRRRVAVGLYLKPEILQVRHRVNTPSLCYLDSVESSFVNLDRQAWCSQILVPL